jgi:hypothetical protein
MDIFGTVVTAGGLIIQFLGACAAYSDEAKSLKARFDWDLRVLKGIRDYFEQKRTQNENHQLSPDDAALLEQTASYLDDFVGRVQKSLGKIERRGLLHGIVSRGTWIARRADLQEMEREVYDWTKRFDVRVLGLPSKLRTIIPATDEVDAPAVVKSNNRLQEFVDLALDAQQTRANEMLLKSSDELASKITSWGDISFLPLENGPEQLIFASRKVSPAVVPGTRDFDKLQMEMGVLAAALNCLGPAGDIRLLKTEYYFYHADSKQFLFAQIPPYRTMSMMTLEKAISGDPFPKAEAALDQRLKLAQKLAEAVFFLHAAGFVHKNITSTSVVVLQRYDTPSDEFSASSIDDAYLMGFDLIRAIEAKTTKEGAVKEDVEESKSIWDFDIFQHPDRQLGVNSPRYINTYDVYSLGVVLLEVGLWEPLSKVVTGLDRGNPSGWAKRLSEVVPSISPRIGVRYQRMVTWCLNLDGSEIIKNTEFVERILDPLEEMVNALS